MQGTGDAWRGKAQRGEGHGNDMKTKPIPRGEFNDAQNALMRRGSPEDHCGRCGCRREHHLPKTTYSYFGVHPVVVPTCCDCPFCFCDCLAFVEPFAGQPFAMCVYEPRPKPAALAPASGQYEYLDVDTAASNRDGAAETAGTERVLNTVGAPSRSPKRTKKPNDEQPRLFA